MLLKTRRVERLMHVYGGSTNPSHWRGGEVYRVEVLLSDCFVSMSTMSQQSPLTDSEACRVVGRPQTQAEVAQAIGMSQSVISKIWNRFLETGSAGRRPG
ncbi:hypothetical protein TNCV_1883321 [Trichonephila clavipes]|nr:hypothetical protein TNCV_1883321 [Trichonephila clavipes]